MSLSHLDQAGAANMVDVSDKNVTHREATASGTIRMNKATFDEVEQQNNRKGDVLAVARIAGIQAAKKTADLIPLCHPLALSKVAIEFSLHPEQCAIEVSCFCKLAGRTGVEMEALTGASIALLTLYDMCKAMDPEMVIEQVKLERKTGGKRGDWQRGMSNVE